MSHTSNQPHSVATRRLFVCVATFVVSAQVAFAQEPVHSFQQLQVGVGQAIVVKPDHGRTMTWSVVSLVGDQLQVERRRWNFKIERKTFTEQTAARIDLRDSTLDGTLIGGGVGLAGAFIIAQTCQAFGCILPFILSVSMGPGIGGGIDQAINRTIYTPGQPARVTFVPLLGRDRIGLTTRLRLGTRP